MEADKLVFMKQFVDNAEYANEIGLLNVIQLFKDPSPGVTGGTSFALGAFATVLRMTSLRPELFTGRVLEALQALAHDTDGQVSAASEAALAALDN